MRRLALLLLSTLFAAAVSAQPTRLPNADTISAAASRTDGPGWVCLVDNGFLLTASETAWVDYMGLHGAAWRVRSSRGRFIVKEGNAWAEPNEPGHPVADALGRRILRYGAPGAIRYLIYGVVEDAGPEPHPSVWVEGPALTGTEADRAILDRIAPRARPASCRYRILYGFFSD